MRMPAIGKFFRTAKKNGRKAFILYLGDPQDPLATEMVFEGFLDKAEFEKLKTTALEIMKRHTGVYQTMEGTKND